MKKYLSYIFLFLGLSAYGQDVIEREYFPGARAKNSAIAAARYAEEGYYYVKFTTFVSALDSSRMFADTAVFFIKRSMMLADTSLYYAPETNIEAIEFLKKGKKHSMDSDSIIRAFYPVTDLQAHNIHGIKASLKSSQAVMEYFNASLLLNAEDSVPESEKERYQIFAYKGEVLRLEADETAFLNLSENLEKEMYNYDQLIHGYNSKIGKTTDEKSKSKIKERLLLIQDAKVESTNKLKRVSTQLEEIRELLDANYLAEVKDIVENQNLAQFETKEIDYYKNEAIQLDTKNPAGLVYKIQIGYYPKTVDKENFYGLFPITGETVNDDLIRFYAGLFYTYADASKGKDYIKENAIANAFIVPFYNGEKINCSQAIQYELQRASQ